MAIANYFALGLTLAALLTGILWVVTRRLGSKLTRNTEAVVDPLTTAGTPPMPAPPCRFLPWAAWIGDFFPMILLVLVVRSFLYEAYQIPSSSMMPTLLVGDFIVVNKFAYGLREPIFQQQLLAGGSPKRGDVAVFKYPEDPSIYYIKRIVGLPGDRVIYRGKRLFIQPARVAGAAQPLAVNYQTTFSVPALTAGEGLTALVEQLGPLSHQILISAQPTDLSAYYQQPGEPLAEWVVPPGHYFAMGDNRDNSRDSRFWGFVPEGHLVGRAVAIWMSLEKQPEAWPTGIRWRRIGAIH